MVCTLPWTRGDIAEIGMVEIEECQGIPLVPQTIRKLVNLELGSNMYDLVMTHLVWWTAGQTWTDNDSSCISVILGPAGPGQVMSDASSFALAP